MSASDPLGFAGMLFAMAIGAYLTRIGGFWLIGRFTIGPRLSRMLDALPGAIIASAVAPIVLKGGVSALVAMVAAVVTMALVRRDIAALFAGIAAAALARAAGF